MELRKTMNTRRVVVTGIGIVSCIGNNKEEVLDSLKAGRSGISYSEDYAERGFRSHVHGKPKIDVTEHIDKKLMRFMGDGAAYNYIAMEQAIADAGLTESEVSNERTGLIMGSGGPSTKNMLWAWDTAREKSAKRVGPFMVPRIMSSTNSATLATPFQIKGVNYSISSACSTSAHCIGNGAEMIQWGKQDIVFAGGGEELDWTMTVVFDAMPALSSGYNDTPEKASRAYDKNRDGFVIAGGGATVVLEELEHAKARGAKIYGELVGYGANSDGFDMVQPSGEGAVRCMKLALQGLNEPVGYINTHGTSTPVGDTRELQAIKEVFGDKLPTISSTKSMTGHSLGATGAQEAIYSLLMMENDFIAPSINIDELDEEAEGMPIARERIDNAGLNLVLSNSFGFGGTNASLAFRKYTD
ncbi:beta-ketoacyl-ACP synthase I [Rhodospirillaceae bacterium KN72]|uniref:3-oxoacyl-[acyl-carrier-protein] synthase 1 n=1 Tax=Pacificispira spongiicola TaxID=2729598 RepID=A0A7Y0E1A4_9PROT|nr:beta-ketoacyl-ACP synthase I [Pacificispira spongiicola]NMM45356.1 beta-ketoacyl-ACP synthase I [Pacificispira spongiicola]